MSSSSAVARVFRTSLFQPSTISRAVRAVLLLSATTPLLINSQHVHASDCTNLATGCAGPAAAGVATEVGPQVDDLTTVAKASAGALDEEDDVGIDISSPGDITLRNSKPLSVSSASGSAIDIRIDARNAKTSNSGALAATSASKSAYGLFVQAQQEATINNTGAITTSAGGVGGNAIGIASGAGNAVNVDNSAAIDATADSWSAAIQANGAEHVTVANHGALSGVATANDRDAGRFGQAYGIHAAGGMSGISISTTNGSDISAAGHGADGIYAGNAYGGDISIVNAGDVMATNRMADGRLARGYANGIRALASSEGSAVEVINDGSVKVESGLLPRGIDAVATGADSTVHVLNNGHVEVASDWYAGSLIRANATGEVFVENAGSLAPTSYSEYAIRTYSTAGNTHVVNSGNVLLDIGGGFGVQSEGQGDITIHNPGNIIGGDGVFDIGVRAISNGGDVDISNTGKIVVGGATTGDIYSQQISALAYQGSIHVDNKGTLGSHGKYAYGTVLSALNGDVVFTNHKGAVIDSNGFYYGVGSYAGSHQGDVTQTNNGDIRVVGRLVDSQNSPVTGPAFTAGMYSTASAGNTTVSNTGTVLVDNEFGSATGIDSYASGAISITNTSAAKITASATGELTGNTNGVGPMRRTFTDNAIGISSGGAHANALIRNNGAIAASSAFGMADGIFATGEVVDIRNGGRIVANGDSWAAGIEAQATQKATVTNTGIIQAVALANDLETGLGYAYGVFATGGPGGVKVTNGAAGTIGATGVYATGVALGNEQGGSATLTNAGSITASDTLASGEQLGGKATGVNALTSVAGSKVTITNTGSINADAFYNAYGVNVQAVGDGSTASVINNGDISAYSRFYLPMGMYVTADKDLRITNAGNITMQEAGGFAINANSNHGAAVVSNSGQILLDNGGYNFGFQVLTGDSVTISNSGHVTAGSGIANGGLGFGALGRAGNGRARFTNSGTLNVASQTSYGVQMLAENGDALVTNTATGKVSVAGANVAIGLLAADLNPDVAHRSQIVNEGTLQVQGSEARAVIGAFARSRIGDASITNRGQVAVNNDQGVAMGLQISAPAGLATLNNSGNITVHGKERGSGMFLVGDRITITNSGTINVSTDSDNPNNAIGVDTLATGAIKFTNSGDIITKSANGSGIAVWLTGGGPLTFVNTGHLEGRVITEIGDNSIVNEAGSTWTLDRQSTDFSGGGNRVHNMAGSVIELADGHIGMGLADNAFRNDGAIRVHGDSSVDMGRAEKIEALQGARGSRHGIGASMPFINNGTLDLSAQGARGNRFTVAGDFGGQGNIRLDASAAERVDALLVNGKLAAATRQQVDMALRGLPDSVAGTKAKTFATVAGGAGRDAFVAGQVIGQNAGNFVNLAVDVAGAPGNADGVASQYQAKVVATGLNPTGQLAASVGSGVQNLLAGQIGTFRDRVGTVANSSGDQRASGYVRSFGNNSDASGALQQNFGGADAIALRQNNSGTELGLSLTPGAGWNLGMVMGKSTGQQSLTGGGFGMSRLNADTAGVAATWLSPRGFYVDGSAWTMRYSGRLDSAAGRQAVDGNANAVNVEAGYTHGFGNGLQLEPQVQYTVTKVDGLRLQGPDAQFAAQASSWNRSRVGVMAWKAFGSHNDIVWTPYASASLVHMAGGDNAYAINQAFQGSMNVLGNSRLFEAGIGLRKQRFGASVGLNYTQGDRVDNVMAGQVAVRYSW